MWKLIFSSETFKCKNPAVGIHQSRVCCDRPPQRLHRHVHINDNHAILGRGLPNAYVLVRFHRDMRKRNELRIDPDARKLHITSKTIGTHKDGIFPALSRRNVNAPRHIKIYCDRSETKPTSPPKIQQESNRVGIVEN